MIVGKKLDALTFNSAPSSAALVYILDGTLDSKVNKSGVIYWLSGTSAGDLVKLDNSGKLPAVDGSQLTNLSFPNGNASYVNFTPGSPPAYSEGRVFYDSSDKSLSYYNDETDITMNIGREMWARVRNNSGATILNGKAVYINSAIGQLPTIRLAIASTLPSSRVIGLATHDIGDNENGYVTIIGEVKGLNTNSFNDGDILYLSAVSAGELTATKPSSPNLVVQMGVVEHAHINQGKILVHPEFDSISVADLYDKSTTNVVFQGLEASSSSESLILKSPNGTRYRIQATNAGALTLTPI